MKNKQWLYVAILGAVLWVTFASVAPLAAASSPPDGFTVTPAELSFVIGVGASQTETVTITNSYATPLRLVATLEGIDETSVRLIPAGPVDAAIANSVKLSATDITIPAHGTYSLKVQVTDKEGLADGGHYASLVLTERPSATTSSTLRSAVAVTMFIIKNQNIRTDLRLNGIRLDHTIFSLPSSSTVMFYNGGNTHVIPRGSISIYDGHTLIAKAIINTASQPLLPDREANFTAPFAVYTRPLLPRRLHVQTMYRIDGSDIQLMKQQSFWYVPFIDVLGLLGVVALLWWQRKGIGRFARKQFKNIQRVVGRMLRPARSRSAKVTTTAHGSTKRILGRTVLRTHRTVTLMRQQASLLAARRQIQVRKSIPVAVVKESPPKDEIATAPVSEPEQSTNSTRAASRNSTAVSSKKPKKASTSTPTPTKKRTTSSTSKRTKKPSTKTSSSKKK